LYSRLGHYSSNRYIFFLGSFWYIICIFLTRNEIDMNFISFWYFLKLVLNRWDTFYTRLTLATVADWWGRCLVSCHTCTELSQAGWQVGRGPGQLPHWLDLVKCVDWAVTQHRWSPAMRFRPSSGDLVSALERGLNGESTGGDNARKRSLEMAPTSTPAVAHSGEKTKMSYG
jgi:hypothetical protein